MSKDKQAVEEMDIIIDLLTDFDEMGFIPTTTVPDPEAYAIEWRNKLTNALKGYRKQSEGEWRLIQTERFCDGSYYSKFFCSLCYREIGVCHDCENDKYKNAKALYPYCHCGAKMSGGNV